MNIITNGHLTIHLLVTEVVSNTLQFITACPFFYMPPCAAIQVFLFFFTNISWEQSSSKCGPQTSVIAISLNLLELQTQVWSPCSLKQKLWGWSLAICVLISPPGDFDIYSKLGIILLEIQIAQWLGHRKPLIWIQKSNHSKEAKVKMKCQKH